MLECARRPNVELHFWGWHPQWAAGQKTGWYEHQGIRYHFQGILPIREFQQSTGILDIAVAPLADTAFNRCKSGQKWFERAAHGTACVLSDLQPYHMATDGVDCLKARNEHGFTRALCALVENAELRQRIGEAGYQTVTQKWSTEAWAARYRRVFGR